MADKNNSRRAESSIKRTRFLGHLGLIAGVFREREVDNDNGSLFNDLFNCRMEIKDKIRRRDLKGSGSERKTNEKTDNEMDISQVSGITELITQKRGKKVRNSKYGRDSLEDFGSNGREI